MVLLRTGYGFHPWDPSKPNAFRGDRPSACAVVPEPNSQRGLEGVLTRGGFFPQERRDPSFSHGRLFGNGQERGNWPQMQLVLQRCGS
jgi:hypothetical protein